jgi:hypothetical protein
MLDDGKAALMAGLKEEMLAVMLGPLPVD